MISAIIAAAGKGTRMKNRNKNKVFIEIEDKPILYYTLKKFDLCEIIDDIYLVLDRESIEKKGPYIEKFQIKKLRKIVEGGKTRGESVYNGLKSMKNSPDLVVVHDGARPFVSKDKIKEVIDVAQDAYGAILGVPLSDTLKKVGSNGYILESVPREIYIRAQTPQVFKYDILLEVYETLGKDIGFVNTDESYLMEKAGYSIKIVKGEEKNIKITTPFDLHLAKLILKEERV